MKKLLIEVEVWETTTDNAVEDLARRITSLAMDAGFVASVESQIKTPSARVVDNAG